MCALQNFANLDKHAISRDGFEGSLGTNQSGIIPVNVNYGMVRFSSLWAAGLNDIAIEIIVDKSLGGRTTPLTIPKKHNVGVVGVGTPVR